MTRPAFQYGTPPFPHQARIVGDTWTRKVFAFLMQQRTGKSKVTLDSAAMLWSADEIDALLVVAKGTLRGTWAWDEVPTHLHPALPRRVAVYDAAGRKADRDAVADILTNLAHRRFFDILVVNDEALATPRGYAVAESFLRSRRCMLAVDEAHRFANPRAQRTRALLKLRPLALYRRILTGTPAEKPLDLWAQFAFLDERILGARSFFAFRNRYAIMGGFNNKVVVGYRFVDEITEKIAPHSVRVTRADVFPDLSAPEFVTILVDLSPTQRRLYGELRDAFVAEWGDGRSVTASSVLTQFLRLHQIVGGFVGDGERVHQLEDTPPKLAALLDLTDDVPGKVVVWAKFVPECRLIAERLTAVYGSGAVVTIGGGMTRDALDAAKRHFKDPNGARFAVVQVEAGAEGLSLTPAATVVFYSNSFSLRARLQAQDRVLGPGQADAITVYDLAARDTLDTKKILPALRAKRRIADTLMGDAPADWI